MKEKSVDGKKTIRYKKTILENGIRIISEEIPSVESFSLGICIAAGSRHDPPELPGIAHFLEHAAFKSTNKRNFKQIASAFESLGSYTNAFTTKDITCFYVRALKNHFNKTFDLLSDLTFNTKFIEKEIEKERAVIQEEIKSYEDDPEEHIFDIGEKLVFGDHRLGNPIIGLTETVEKISVDDLRKFHTENYAGSNVIVSVAGNISHEAVLAQAEKYLYAVPAITGIKDNSTPDPTKPTRQELTKSFQQAHILLIRDVPGVNSPERYPLAILNVILGDGMSSRLYQNLRERYGLAYTIFSSLQMMNDCGVFYIYAGLEKKQLPKTEKLLINVMDSITSSKISVKEFSRAQEQLKANTIMALESMSTRMQALAKSEIEKGCYEDIQSTIEAIDGVKLGNVQELAEFYMPVANWNTVLFVPEE